MAFEATGAVLLLEVRGTGLEAGSSQDPLAAARALLEARGPGWAPASGPGLSGSLTLADPAETFPLLHRLRTELRAEPDRPRAVVAAGLGLGDELAASRLAGEAFRALGRRNRDLTRALTADADSNAVLGALCRTIDTLIKGWTDAQWQAIHRRDRGRTLQEIGEELGIAYQNVSKRLIAARYSLYREVLAAAGLVFDRAAER
jgi:hypothetical protein